MSIQTIDFTIRRIVAETRVLKHQAAIEETDAEAMACINLANGLERAVRLLNRQLGRDEDEGLDTKGR